MGYLTRRSGYRVNTTAEATAIRIEYQSMSAKQITAPTITFALVSITKDPAISV
jgi:hypothetical protein